MNENRKEIFIELDRISKLQDNWDGLRANSVSGACIENTGRIISDLDTDVASPEIYPNPNGTLTLDWETGGQLLSIEIGDDRFSTYWETDNARQSVIRPTPSKKPG